MSYVDFCVEKVRVCEFGTCSCMLRIRLIVANWESVDWERSVLVSNPDRVRNHAVWSYIWLNILSNEKWPFYPAKILFIYNLYHLDTKTSHFKYKPPPQHTLESSVPKLSSIPTHNPFMPLIPIWCQQNPSFILILLHFQFQSLNTHNKKSLSFAAIYNSILQTQLWNTCLIIS